MVLVGVVCVGPHNEMGINNRCCFNIPEDRKFFQSLITGQTVIVGRKTYECMPMSVLQLCKNVIVLTSALMTDINNIHFTDNIDEKYITCNDPIYVIGGQYTYKYLERYINTWYVTYVNYKPAKIADVYFDVDLSHHKFMNVLQTGEGWMTVKQHK